MNLDDLKKESLRIYGPVLSLEKIVSHIWRRKLKLGFFILFSIGILFNLIFYIFTEFSNGFIVSQYRDQITALTGFFFLTWLVFFQAEAFYYSYYFKGKKNSDFFLDFDLAKIITNLSQNPVEDFFNQKVGLIILHRSGISLDEFNNFIQNKKTKLTSSELNINFVNNTVTLFDFVVSLFNFDKELSEFFFAHNIREKEIKGIIDWIVELNVSRIEEERWWGEGNLLRSEGIGRDWSYGQIYTLKKYEKTLSSPLARRYRIHSSYGVKELAELENILSRKNGANAVLVSDDETGRLQIISHLSDMILMGTAITSLHHKRVILLDDDKFIAVNGTKQDFEREIIVMMREAVKSGNVILVFDDFPALVASCKNIGVDLPSILETYLDSSSLQIIALSDTNGFHSIIENNPILSQKFEKILVKDIDDTNTIKVLQNEIVSYEREGLFFTYQSLEAITESAERYFSDGVMPDKAIDLLSEIGPKLHSLGKELVEREDILSLVESKTGIPLGQVSNDEKEKLLHLEEILHKRIVGQNEAIKAISSAIRRARSGITNPNRPLGSFLFLGPTGVGKTETTKALSDIFFGGKGEILRLDMSEYSSFDSVSKLIGSFESKQSGVLSSMVREKQYGVLLVDEFEKTTKEVMNLFLQILDEGFFSDGSGKKVSMKNLVIVATSNAGSDLIWELVKQGEDLSKAKDSVIEETIKKGIFRPELLNRFDGVILFHPLENNHLREIASLQLNSLKQRLSDQGYNLVVNDELINYVASFGTDPKFGARSMNRAVQEKVEDKISQKIIEGSLPKGSKIELTSLDLTK